MFSKLNLFFK